MKKFTTIIAITALAALTLSACEISIELPSEGEMFDPDGGLIVVDDTTEVDETAEPALSIEDELKQAFLNKYPEWNIDNIVIDLKTSDAEFASGGVGFADSFGGGYFYAANTTDGWVIAWDGNGSVGCADIEPYNFPSDLIRYCYDYENDVEVER